MRFWAVAVSGVALSASCAGDTPPSDLAPPDLLKISVFYPVDGLVRGRGLEGTVNDPRITHIRIASHPTQGETIVPVEADGSFSFSVIAISDDLLEISAATDDQATDRGEPVYLIVPPTPLPPPNFVCCGAAGGRNGTCQDEDSAAAGDACPDAATGITQCQVDRDCGVESGEVLPLDVGRFVITSPDAEGRISIAGNAEPDALITLENRGQSAVGGYRPAYRRQVRITDKVGNFAFDSIVARGDDELIFQVHDLLGFRSPAASVLVPDSMVAGVDVIGAFEFEALSPSQEGKVAVLVQPYGIDGRGICPNTDEAPILCLSGGLTYGMLNLRNITIDNKPVSATPTPTSETLPHTRGLLGGDDPLAGPQDVVVVLDMSTAAKMKDTEPRRFSDVRNFIRGLRSRDYVALVTFGAMAEARTPLLAPTERQIAIDDLNALENMEPGGDPNVFQGVSIAAQLLTEARTRRPGKIVALTLGDQPGTMDVATAAFDAALDKVSADPVQGFDGYAVYIIAVLDNVMPAPNLTLLSDMAAFSGGEFRQLLVLNPLEQALADARTQLSGSFILLYNMLIPEGVGKQGTISFTAEVVLPGSQKVESTYSGPLTVTNGN